MIFWISSCGSLNQDDSKRLDDADTPQEEIQDDNNSDSTISNNVESPKEEVKDSNDKKDSDKIYDDNIVWGPLS